MAAVNKGSVMIELVTDALPVGITVALSSEPSSRLMTSITDGDVGVLVHIEVSTVKLIDSPVRQYQGPSGYLTSMDMTHLPGSCFSSSPRLQGGRE